MSVAKIMELAAKTFKERNALYGDNYLNAGKALMELFPKGLVLKSIDDWTRIHILMLVIVKLTRYCNNWQSGGHADSIHDAMVYSAMLESIDAEIAGRVFIPVNQTFTCCSDCMSPQTCAIEHKCCCIITMQPKSFAPCDHCATITMCTDEKHCDLIYNGYR